MNTLKLFHPLIGKWFRERVGNPTDIQKSSWPEIADGHHVLVTAPTGSGKTLTAFLWAINSFVARTESIDTKRVLYISPLRTAVRISGNCSPADAKYDCSSAIGVSRFRLISLLSALSGEM